MTKRTDDDSGNMIRNVSMIVQEPGEVEKDDSMPRKSRPQRGGRASHIGRVPAKKDYHVSSKIPLRACAGARSSEGEGMEAARGPIIDVLELETATPASMCVQNASRTRNAAFA